MAVSAELVKELREKTGAGIMDCRRALDATNGDIAKASEVLAAKGIEKAGKKADRVTGSGAVFSYIHGVGRVGVLLEIGCETDFVAKTDDFQSLGKELGMQISAMNPSTLDELLEQPYIRDSKLTINDLVKSSISKLGENILVKRFVRYELNQS
ncbi:MAG: translation elongation factor Ts [bacterium]|nr:translation elongation factor Ts [bacterium]